MLIREAEERLRELGFRYFYSDDNDHRATFGVWPDDQFLEGLPTGHAAIEGYAWRWEHGKGEKELGHVARKRLAAERLVRFVERLRGEGDG